MVGAVDHGVGCRALGGACLPPLLRLGGVGSRGCQRRRSGTRSGDIGLESRKNWTIFPAEMTENLLDWERSNFSAEVRKTLGFKQG